MCGCRVYANNKMKNLNHENKNKKKNKEKKTNTKKIKKGQEEIENRTIK